MRLKPIDIAHRRIVELVEIRNGAGELVANGKRFLIAYDDGLIDLAGAVEMIMLKLTGKLLQPKFRPAITNPAALMCDKLLISDYSRYDGSQGPAPVPAYQPCTVTGRLLQTHYMHCEIAGNRWDNWFCRLDELAKILYSIMREAQADPWKPAIAVQAAANA